MSGQKIAVKRRNSARIGICAGEGICTKRLWKTIPHPRSTEKNEWSPTVFILTCRPRHLILCSRSFLSQGRLLLRSVSCLAWSTNCCFGVECRLSHAYHKPFKLCVRYRKLSSVTMRLVFVTLRRYRRINITWGTTRLRESEDSNERAGAKSFKSPDR